MNRPNRLHTSPPAYPHAVHSLLLSDVTPEEFTKAAAAATKDADAVALLRKLYPRADKDKSPDAEIDERANPEWAVVLKKLRDEAVTTANQFKPIEANRTRTDKLSKLMRRVHQSIVNQDARETEATEPESEGSGTLYRLLTEPQ